MVGDDEALIDEVVSRVEEVSDLPSPELVAALRPVVADLMQATHVDGSWPDAVLIGEALSIMLEPLDAVRIGPGAATLGLTDDDQRWLDACRAACRSVELLNDMLDDLRRGTRPHGPPVHGTD